MSVLHDDLLRAIATRPRDAGPRVVPARRAGVTLSPVSGFRTMAQQKSLYAAYRAGHGNLAARPGYSNHQGGTSVDVSTNGSYSSAAYKWLARHGRQYGFVNDVRGEPWHWTFRG